MNKQYLSILGGLSLAMASLMPLQAAAQSGPGASVEWTVGTGPEPTVFFDAPAGYEKHYRVCIKKTPADTKVEVVLADRTIPIMNEICVDVVSNLISVKMLAGSEPATGIYFLVD